MIPQTAFAVIANFHVTGLIQSSDGKVMPRSKVVFSDKDGKEVAESQSGPDGRYQALVPEGEYSVTVMAPQEEKLDNIVFKSQIIDADTNRDFTFITGSKSNPGIQKNASAQRFSLNVSNIIIVVVVLALIIVGLLIGRTLLKKRKNTTPKEEKS